MDFEMMNEQKVFHKCKKEYNSMLLPATVNGLNVF